jgi:hypothetical protein
MGKWQAKSSGGNRGTLKKCTALEHGNDLQKRDARSLAELARSGREKSCLLKPFFKEDRMQDKRPTIR